MLARSSQHVGSPVMKFKPLVASATMVLVVFGAGCNRGLTAEKADGIITAHPKAIGVTPVSTEGISATSETEAITKTKIGDEVLNLKFRRYDKEWRWEFVETKGGGWIASEEVLDQ